MDSPDKDTKTVLLVGGLGTRLRSVVSSKPKPMASVGDRPFLELLVQQLCQQGFRRLVFCTGYLAGEIEKEFGDGRKWGVNIEYSQEDQPLGTAGAIKHAEPYLQGAPEFLILNGDSFLAMDIQELLQFHRRSGGIARTAVLRMKNEKRYGTVEVSPGGRVTGFVEKNEPSAPGLINAGIYVFSHRILEFIPEGPGSLEKDIFPKLLKQGVFALEQQGIFIDIGTPEDYSRAQELQGRLRETASAKRDPNSPSRQ